MLKKKRFLSGKSKYLLLLPAMGLLVAFSGCKSKNKPEATEPVVEEIVVLEVEDTLAVATPVPPAAATKPAATPVKTPAKTTPPKTTKDVEPAPAAPQPPVVNEEHVFEVTETMPEFPGGNAEMMKYLKKHTKYPVVAEEKGVEGKVIVQFVVNRDGSIVEPTVVKSVDPSLDKEAIRVVSSMPKWKPGVQGGKIVRTKYTLPVLFELK